MPRLDSFSVYDIVQCFNWRNGVLYSKCVPVCSQICGFTCVSIHTCVCHMCVWCVFVCVHVHVRCVGCW